MKLIWKWIIGVICLLLVAVLAISWYLSHNWKPILEARLKETVEKSTSGLYKLSLKDIEMNIPLGSVTLSDVELISDTTIYKKMVLARTAPNTRFHLKVSALKVRRFDLWDVLMNRELYIRSIAIESPQVHMISQRHAYNDTIRTQAPKSLYDNIKDVLTSINVRDVELENIKFKYSKIENGKSSDLELDSVGVKIKDILVDKTSIGDTSRLYYTKMVEIDVPGFEYLLSNGFYKAKFDRLLINTQDQNVLFTNVQYVPRMSKTEYFNKRKENLTMVELNFDTLRFEQLDFKQVIDNQQTIAKKVQIKNGSIALYNDKRYPKKTRSQIGNAPHQRLMQVKQLIRLDSVFLDHIDVLYGEFSAKHGRHGEITFEKTTGVISNVTNDSSLLQSNKTLRTQVETRVMGKGLLKLDMGMDLLSKNGAHTYRGSLGSMDARAFNRILDPLLRVKISSGNIRRISFNMQGTDRKNWGEFRFDYTNLKLNIENILGSKTSKFRKGLASFVVNSILINESNPDEKGIHHIAKVNYTRVPSHSFFKTMWQSLLEGVKYCAGISKKREAKLIGAAHEAKEVVKESKKIVKKTKTFFNGIFKKKENDEKKEEEKK